MQLYEHDSLYFRHRASSEALPLHASLRGLEFPANVRQMLRRLCDQPFCARVYNFFWPRGQD